MSLALPLYRGFLIYHDPDGWYGEVDGGSCFGPFDSRAELHAAIDKHLG